MSSKAHVSATRYAEDAAVGSDVILQGTPTPLDWRELAERRLSKLLEVAHEAATAHTRLSLLQSEYHALLRRSEDRARQVVTLEHQLSKVQGQLGKLEHQLEQLFASNSWRWTRSLRWLGSKLRYARQMVSSTVFLLTRVAPIRFIARALLRIFPGFGDRLRASIHAWRQWG